ncbi:hypothetical protein M406DRAFT_263881 [Cryphonectria parasitica EP155]|uniref:Capsule polysaccharide biosynthesis protein n=1 Tax=Cryphonectria parasitica (strain ATCC 38755 / EP155) TaxID=660469 RepID=A0A9P4XYM0_CRYP1|nr:uncharacterized protein M406DRAFT_263881 [Cryphonectria parasitica EP155]KAF3762930.1 hypothetical protein M406DRAFT_263881 [Cryphonectria parasitica EP155]
MASANALGYILPLGMGSAAVAGLSLAHVDWKTIILKFVTGPGRTSRILLAIFVLINYKSMPFMWTYRVLGAITRQHLPYLRPARLHPRMLFHYSITSSYNSLLETDYNFHKSNSTYFSDLDVARSHCVSHLLRPGMDAIARNAETQCVRTKDGELAKGGMAVGLGAVFCSFRREVAVLQGYEMWTRVLAWDRKWVYLVTHFVVKGKVRPTAWDQDGSERWFGPLRKKQKTAGLSGAEAKELEKHVIATAVSKYVFKVGRFTVHPAILLEKSGLLPARPGGWIGGVNEVWDEVVDEDLGGAQNGESEEEDGVGDWRQVESQRRQGMKFAERFAALDGLNGLFDGGEHGALGRFYPG